MRNIVVLKGKEVRLGLRDFRVRRVVNEASEKEKTGL